VLLGVDLFERRGTDPAAEFLGRLAEKHDFPDTDLLIRQCPPQKYNTLAVDILLRVNAEES
jgi:hypothetical protein